MHLITISDLALWTFRIKKNSNACLFSVASASRLKLAASDSGLRLWTPDGFI
ncbi:2877_t:CDS:2 [Diversispora eburnea]|uniref:2877_t:CDS:1 n=1 Tax=Diversispora eburnea TaxID=1213867 RepID=A0A9N8VE78_9GLOM|nr:2877_t:CDS:2 [Diversispora eburnea]